MILIGDEMLNLNFIFGRNIHVYLFFSFGLGFHHAANCLPVATLVIHGRGTEKERRFAWSQAMACPWITALDGKLFQISF